MLTAYQQHDVQELCRVMFDALEKCWKETEQKNLIKDLYEGGISDCVKCLEVGHYQGQGIYRRGLISDC